LTAQPGRCGEDWTRGHDAATQQGAQWGAQHCINGLALDFVPAAKAS
jgi:peptide methionine sulfoxide reductase MsrB